jgi:hypothetical protein
MSLFRHKTKFVGLLLASIAASPAAAGDPSLELADFQSMATDLAADDLAGGNLTQQSFTEVAYAGNAAAAPCHCGNACCNCQPSKPAPPNPCATSHKILFYANDFSYLCKPDYDGCCLGDGLKLMPVGHNCRWGTLDVGGQFRLRYHHELGMGQSAVLGPQRFLDTEHDFLLERLRLYTNWKANDWLRVYIEGIYADVTREDDYVPRNIDRNHGDLLNAFVDVGVTDDVTVRFGRQELLYGAQRFISPLDWANTRRTFEGVKLLYTSGDMALDGFYTNFVPVQPFNFDEADYNQSFYGLWGTYSGYSDATVDLFWIGYEDETAAFSIYTGGGRIYGGMDDWLWELTGAGQTGDAAGLAGTDHQAAMSTVGLGRLLGDSSWKPTAWVYYDYASGNPSPNVVGTDNAFNQLFPLAHKYLGFIDAVQRSNIEAVNFLFTAAPTKKTDLLLWYYIFQSNGTSPVPSIGGTPPQSTSKDFGQELDVILTYKIGPRSNILFGWSHLWRGNKILNPQDADFLYSQWELNF